MSYLGQVMSEDGSPSFKRWSGAFMLLLWALITLVNLFAGKKLDTVIQDQTYYVLITTLGLVFGGNVLNRITEVKKVQSANNASVGKASPQPDVVVAPTTPASN